MKPVSRSERISQGRAYVRYIVVSRPFENQVHRFYLKQIYKYLRISANTLIQPITVMVIFLIFYDRYNNFIFLIFLVIFFFTFYNFKRRIIYTFYTLILIYNINNLKSFNV